MTDSWLLCGSFNFLPVCFIHLPTPIFWWSYVYCSHQGQCVLLKGFFYIDLFCWRALYACGGQRITSLGTIWASGVELSFFSLCTMLFLSLYSLGLRVEFWLSVLAESTFSTRTISPAPIHFSSVSQEYKAKIPLMLSQDHYCLCDSFLRVISNVYVHINTFILHF